MAAWFTYLYLYGPKPRRNVPDLEGTGLSRPAEFGWKLHDLEGRSQTLEEYRGRTVFLNIWATWCPPCVGEMPAIARLAAAASSPGSGLERVAFVCVSIDEDVETVRRYVAGKGWPMTVRHTSPEELPPVFTTDGIPATFLIGPDGRIAAAAAGSAEWDDPSVVEFLRRLDRGGAGRAGAGAGAGEAAAGQDD
jgi:thiol-disulfide isomerase/thioredoxin